MNTKRDFLFDFYLPLPNFVLALLLIYLGIFLGGFSDLALADTHPNPTTENQTSAMPQDTPATPSSTEASGPSEPSPPEQNQISNPTSSANDISNEVNNIDYREWDTFADNLKNCQASSHVLPDPIKVGVLKMAFSLSTTQSIPLPLSVEQIQTMLQGAKINYTIFGWSDNTNQAKCHVEISQIKTDTPPIPGLPNSPMDLPGVLDCNIAKADIPELYDNAKNISKLADSLNIDQNLQNIAIRSCTLVAKPRQPEASQQETPPTKPAAPPQGKTNKTSKKQKQSSSPVSQTDASSSEQPTPSETNNSPSPTDSSSLSPKEKLKQSNLFNMPELPKIPDMSGFFALER